MDHKIVLSLTWVEYEALEDQATRDFRTIEEEARFLIFNSLSQRGRINIDQILAIKQERQEQERPKVTKEALGKLRETLVEQNRRIQQEPVYPSLDELLNQLSPSAGELTDSSSTEKVDSVVWEDVDLVVEAPLDPPKRYWQNKESNLYKVYRHFVDHPQTAFATREMGERVGLTYTQVSSVVHRLRHMGYIEVVGEVIVDEEGTKNTTYQLTEAALRGWEDRPKVWD